MGGCSLTRYSWDAPVEHDQDEMEGEIGCLAASGRVTEAHEDEEPQDVQSMETSRETIIIEQK